MVAWPATCDQPRMEEALRRNGARPRIVFRTASNETLLSMVRSGLGIAVLPQLATISAAGDDRLRVHALDPSPSREIYLHWPSRRTLSPLALRAIEMAQELGVSSEPAARPKRDGRRGEATPYVAACQRRYLSHGPVIGQRDAGCLDVHEQDLAVRRRTSGR